MSICINYYTATIIRFVELVRSIMPMIEMILTREFRDPHWNFMQVKLFVFMCTGCFDMYTLKKENDLWYFWNFRFFRDSFIEESNIIKIVREIYFVYGKVLVLWIVAFGCLLTIRIKTYQLFIHLKFWEVF